MMFPFFPSPVVPHVKPVPAGRTRIVAALDIGSSKMSCLIAKLKPLGSCMPGDEGHYGRTHAAEVMGIGHQAARGVVSGTIVDLDAAEGSIRSVVDAAERMASVTVDDLIVNVSCGHVRSEIFAVDVAIKSGQVDGAAIHSVLATSKQAAESRERTILHAVPLTFSLDGSRRIRDPSGMIGRKLSADIHIASADLMSLRNLILCIRRCHLRVEGVAVTPCVSSLACLMPDEMELGTMVIDMGAQTTSVAVLHESKCVYCDVLPLGGAHITSDIAQGLSVSLADAERIKTLHGGVFGSDLDSGRLISFSPMDSDPAGRVDHVQHLALVNIIRPRLEEIFELIRDRLFANPSIRHFVRSIVLTGGASQLLGVTDFVRQFFLMPARVGTPRGINGLPSFARGPSFSAVCGLALYPQDVRVLDAKEVVVSSQHIPSSQKYWVRVGHWIRQGF